VSRLLSIEGVALAQGLLTGGLDSHSIRTTPRSLIGHSLLPMTDSDSPPKKSPADRITPSRPSDSIGDRDLVDALALYLSVTRDRNDVRSAIATWRNDVINAGLQPETLLVHFKHILLGLTVAQQSTNYEERLSDRREMILMCIEEYFRGNPSSPESD
jgi:hypothetical protein